MNLFGLWRLNCSVCVSWTRPSALSRDSRGKCISPAPHFLLCAGLSFPAGCVLAARFAGCGRGPSLRCVHLRRICSSLPASAAAEPCSPFTSAARRIPRFFAGRQCCFVSHTRYYAQSRLYCDILSDQIEGTLAHIDVLTVLNPLLFPRVQQLEFLRRANRAFQ